MKIDHLIVEEDESIKPVTKAEIYFYKYKLDTVTDWGYIFKEFDFSKFIKYYRNKWIFMSVIKRARFMEMEHQDLERYMRDLNEKKDRIKVEIGIC